MRGHPLLGIPWWRQLPAAAPQVLNRVRLQPEYLRLQPYLFIGLIKLTTYRTV